MMDGGLDFCLSLIQPDEKAGPVSFCFDGELEPLNEKDYDCALDLFRTLTAIKCLDATRKLGIGFYLEAHVRSTSWLLGGLCKGASFAAEIPAGKLASFEEALGSELSRIKVEDKENKAARTN